MPGSKGKHLDRYDRGVIEDGIRCGLSAREIARRLDVHPATVIREVRANRDVSAPGKRRASAAARCTRFEDCQHRRDACPVCEAPERRSLCRRCATVRCYERCDEFEQRMCERTERWPYVCTCVGYERSNCVLPKCRYSADAAAESASGRRARTRRGPSVSAEELARMSEMVAPLVKKGQSLEAIWATHGDELPVSFRTFYGYIEDGYVDGIISLDLPRKVRYKKRKRARARAVADREGRLYKDFLALSEEDRRRAVQVDTVVGLARNSRRILSVQVARFSFQLYILLESGSSSQVVAALDAMELAMGSREDFSIHFGIMLTDRGGEFDDFAGMERSVLEPGKRRCRVYYCDAMSPNQKPNCERNHEELRRILPKGRADFDALSAWDVAVVCSHVNSYPRKALGGACPYDLASQVFPGEFLDALGVERVDPDDVTLRPGLMRHAICKRV